MKVEIIPKFSSEFLDSTDCNFRGIIKIINNDGFKTAEQELKNGVATDVTGSTGNKNGFVEHIGSGGSVLGLERGIGKFGRR